MGKYRGNSGNSDLNSRLTGLRTTNSKPQYIQFNDNRINKRFRKPAAAATMPSNDARLKLIQQQQHHQRNSQFDARRLLTTSDNPRNKSFTSRLSHHHQQHHRHSDSNSGSGSDTESSSTSKRKNKEPLVIVTGLGNVRRDGDSSVRIINKPQHKHHQVIANGDKTLVTLTNDLAKNTKDFESFKIQITNDKITVTTPTTTSTTNKKSENKHSHSAQQMQMDYEMSSNNISSSSSSAAAIKSVFNRTGGGGSMYSSSTSVIHPYTDNINFYSPSSSSPSSSSKVAAEAMARDGYKLLISNLHSRVSEDDVLVIRFPALHLFFLNRYFFNFAFLAKTFLNKYSSK